MVFNLNFKFGVVVKFIKIKFVMKRVGGYYFLIFPVSVITIPKFI
jgi:hypothetical protein